MEKCIIVAIADNNAIGRDNALLWHISEDMKFFRKTTTGSPVIMGRKTFESIGRPLPKRLNIIISRSGYQAPEGVLVASSLEEAYRFADESLSCGSRSEEILKTADPVSRCFVIGGGQIYARAMETADRLIVTHVNTVIGDADTFFPQIDPLVWKVAERSGCMHDEESGFDFEFVTYERMK